MEKKKKIIIVHHENDKKDVTDLKKKLEEEECDVNSNSVDSSDIQDEDEEDCKSRLKDEICEADTFVYILSGNTNCIDLVEWEIEEANKAGKRIVGVYGSGVTSEVDIPRGIRSYSDSIVHWSLTDIVNSLRNNAYVSTTPTGTTRPSVEKGIDRENC